MVLSYKHERQVNKMDEGQRVRELRKELGLTLEKFGKPLGVGKTAISKIENGENNLTDQMILAICREYNVDEKWLRTGEGEMFKKLNRQQELAQLTVTLFKEEEDSFKSRLIMALAQLNEEEWELLEKISDKIAKKKD